MARILLTTRCRDSGLYDYFRENAPRNFRWRFGMPRRISSRSSRCPHESRYPLLTTAFTPPPLDLAQSTFELLPTRTTPPLFENRQP